MTAEEGYDLQRVYGEKVGGPFSFRWADRWWTLPNMLMLDFEVQDRIENLDTTAADKDALNALFDELLGPEQAPEWRKAARPIGALLDMLRQWTEHSKAKLGESPASDGSSKSTGRPSNPTSAASTASNSRKSSTAKRAPRKAAFPRGKSSP